MQTVQLRFPLETLQHPVPRRQNRFNNSKQWWQIDKREGSRRYRKILGVPKYFTSPHYQLQWEWLCHRHQRWWQGCDHDSISSAKSAGSSIQKIHRAWGQICDHQIRRQDCDPRLYILDPDRQQDPQKLEAACCPPATQSSYGSSIIRAGWDYYRTHHGHLSSSPSAELALNPTRPLPCPQIRPVIQHLITTTLQLNGFSVGTKKRKKQRAITRFDLNPVYPAT